MKNVSIKPIIFKISLLCICALFSSCAQTLIYSDIKMNKADYSIKEGEEKNLLIKNGFKINTPENFAYELDEKTLYFSAQNDRGGGSIFSSELDSYNTINKYKAVELIVKANLNDCYDIHVYETDVDNRDGYIIEGYNFEGDYNEYSYLSYFGKYWWVLDISPSSASILKDSVEALKIISSLERVPESFSARKAEGLPSFLCKDGSVYWMTDMKHTGYIIGGNYEDGFGLISLTKKNPADDTQSSDTSETAERHTDTIYFANKPYIAQWYGKYTSKNGDITMTETSGWYYSFNIDNEKYELGLHTYGDIPLSQILGLHEKGFFKNVLKNCFFTDDEGFYAKLNGKGKIENLGRNINTLASELNPIISPDGQTLYFTRDHHPGNTEQYYYYNNQDIWYAELQSDGTWGEATNIGKPLNTHSPNSLSSISPDGNTCLLLGNYAVNDKDKPLAISHRVANGWGKPEGIKIPNYYNNRNSSSGCMSSDGKAIINSLERSDSESMDLYVSFRTNDSMWTEPLNMGNINSKEEDICPFIAPDGITLYFSSDREGGYGEYDVYYSKRLDSTWTNWSEPKNLGPEINTSGSEMYYTISAKGDYVYFSTSAYSYGNLDICRIELSEEFKPKPVVLVKGRVFNLKTNEPIEAKVFYEILPEGKEAGIARSNPKSGEYKIVLPVGSEYGFRAEANGYYAINENFSTEDITEYTEIERNIGMYFIEKGERITLNNIFFDYDKSELKPESFPELNRLAAILKKFPDRKVEIAGHTDDQGGDAYNKQLSQARAQAVVEYLIKKGIKKEKIIAKGYGESKPVTNNNTEEGRAENRRVEFMFID